MGIQFYFLTAVTMSESSLFSRGKLAVFAAELTCLDMLTEIAPPSLLPWRVLQLTFYLIILFKGYVVQSDFWEEVDQYYFQV